MAEIPRSERISDWHCVDVYTPENIGGLGNDPHLHDALFLLRCGIWELRDMNGIEMTLREQSKYEIANAYGYGNTFIGYWELQKTNNREPFLLVDWNTKDGIVAVAEGRKYFYAGTGEEAIFINWVVIRDTGSNDNDDYTYRGKKVAKRLYDKIEEQALECGVTLLIAGVNPLNGRSARFHEKSGFSKEQFSGEVASDGNPLPHRTPNGAFIPSFPIHGTDSRNNPVEGAIEFHTKRLR